MRWVALYARGPAVFDRDEHSTSVRTIMRTGGVDDLLHGMIIVGCSKALDVIAKFRDHSWPKVLAILF